MIGIKKTKLEKKKRLTVIGNGMVGVKFLEHLVESGERVQFEIVVYGEEPIPGYDRIHLTDHIGNEDREAILLHPVEWYEEHGIQLILDEKIIAIDRKQKVIQSDKNNFSGYDKLVLATGSYPFIPPIEGIENEGIYTYRDYQDLRKIEKKGIASSRAVVIGGGLLGLEAAAAINKLNCQVTILEGATGVLARQLDVEAGGIVKSAIENLGISVLTEASVSHIEKDGECIRIHLNGEIILQADMVVVATGVRPRDELGRQSDLDIGILGGIRVNDSLQTSDPDIYGIGECVIHRNVCYGLAAPGFKMAHVLANNLIQNTDKFQFKGMDQSTRLKVAGLEVSVMGEFHGDGEHLVHRNGNSYRKIIHENRNLTGGIVIGQWDELGRIQTLIDARQRVGVWNLSRFRKSGNIYTTRTRNPDPAQWPPKTIICNCMKVTHQEICRSISQTSNASLESISQTCGAGSVCGTCRPILTKLVAASGSNVGLPPSGVAASLPWKGIFTASAMAVLLCLAILLVPKVPASQSVQDGFLLDELIRSNLYKQVTGYSVLGILTAGMILSFRKRIKWKWFTRIDFSNFRMFHMISGILGLVIVGCHTGFSLGNNFNFLLMLNYLLLSVIGALAGVSTALTNRNQTHSAMAIRRISTLGHVILFWPFPVLVIYHILMVYFY